MRTLSLVATDPILNIWRKRTRYVWTSLNNTAHLWCLDIFEQRMTKTDANIPWYRCNTCPLAPTNLGGISLQSWQHINHKQEFFVKWTSNASCDIGTHSYFTQQTNCLVFRKAWNILEQNPLHLVARVNEIQPHNSCAVAKMKDQIHQRTNKAILRVTNKSVLRS